VWPFELHNWSFIWHLTLYVTYTLKSLPSFLLWTLRFNVIFFPSGGLPKFPVGPFVSCLLFFLQLFLVWLCFSHSLTINKVRWECERSGAEICSLSLLSHGDFGASACFCLQWTPRPWLCKAFL
jgi:hypothetical protein